MTQTVQYSRDGGQTWHPTPPPGSFGLSRIGGTLGKLVAAAQAFTGDGSRWTHAFIVLDDIAVLEAKPGGVVIAPLVNRLNDPEVVFSDEPVEEWLATVRKREEDHGALPPPESYYEAIERARRTDIVAHARALQGVSYGYLQYLALGLATLGFQPRWLRKWIADRGNLICSQLVDAVYRRAGIQLFDDGRLPQDVTPGDLAVRFGIA